jgi:flagella basal body P-ring formation protein FlgA
MRRPAGARALAPAAALAVRSRRRGPGGAGPGAGAARRVDVRHVPARAARALARGETLAAADIDAAGADGVRLVGWTTRRVIAAGEPLRAPAVAPPAAVRAGEPVALLYQADGVTLRLAGTAATDAPVGGRVAVRVDTRRRFEGVVAGPGLVRLP